MKRIDRIVILGGGTSAWLTAACLSHNLPDIDITIVDKEVGEPVGVGEGTIVGFDRFLTNCGFDIDEWFPAIDATFKTGILFPNWDKEGNDIWHPFSQSRTVVENTKIKIIDLWTLNQNLDFKKYGSQFYECNVLNNKIDFNQPYAFHIDAGKLVKYIQGKIKNSITLIKSEMTDVVRDNSDNIIKLILKNNQEIYGDLYIDCTGFKGLLNQNPKRVDLKHRLFCDTAVAGHIPYIDRDTELHPYVKSEAVDHGWIWNIPVRTRIGSGLVFNRSITDIEEAKEYFVKYWNNRISKENLKVIDWTPYYNENIWQNNVVSVGLSAGFIEPLESTGIALIILGIEQLVGRINCQIYNDLDIKIYNDILKYAFEHSIDFINMHYSNNARNTPFWNFVKNTRQNSKTQNYYLDFIAKNKNLFPIGNKEQNIIPELSWILWLIQLGYPVMPRELAIDNAQETMLKYLNQEKYKIIQAKKHIDEIKKLELYYKL